MHVWLMSKLIYYEDILAYSIINYSLIGLPPL